LRGGREACHIPHAMSPERAITPTQFHLASLTHWEQMENASCPALRHPPPTPVASPNRNGSIESVPESVRRPALASSAGTPPIESQRYTSISITGTPPASLSDWIAPTIRSDSKSRACQPLTSDQNTRHFNVSPCSPNFSMAHRCFVRARSPAWPCTCTCAWRASPD